MLHLAYEDHLAPGSGGGAIRTKEINTRLADRFRIDQVFAPYAGARVRHESNDLASTHLGFRRGGKFVRQLGYFAKLPLYVRRAAPRYDLIVEDFGAPFGSIGLPHISRTPTLAVVQWLFAREKSEQYHLPFQAVENFGVRAHTRYIAVSQGIAEQIRDRNPTAHVDVVVNGLPDVALAGIDPSHGRKDVLFLGRLDVEHKGLDLLLAAFAASAPHIGQNLVIAGDGPGEAWIRAEIDRLKLGHRVHLVGRIPAEDRFHALASSDVVVMPSRYESFGMVAAEATAMGTPVLGFDIPCLRDLIPAALRVPAYDVDRFAELLTTICSEGLLREQIGASLPFSVAHLSWDALASQQAAVYEDVIARSNRERRVRQ